MHDHAHELTLGLAFGLGALHALEPGHGKTAMLVYLAGERRSLLHPLVMGLSSALAHSVSLIGVAATVHLTHHLITGDHDHNNDAVTHGMQWISAGLVVLVGLWMAIAAWRAKPSTCGCSAHQHSCDDKTTSPNRDARSSMSSGSPIAAYGVIGLFAAGIAFSLTVVGVLVQVFGGRLQKTQSWFSQLPWATIRAAMILSIGSYYVWRLVGQV